MIAFDEQQDFAKENVSSSTVDGSRVPRNYSSNGVGAFDSFISIMRQHLSVAAISLLVVFAIFAIYILTRQPLYSSLTLIDLNPNIHVANGSGDVSQQKLSYEEANAEVATQIEFIRGDYLSLEACNKLGLLQSQEFVRALKAPVSGVCNNLSPHDRSIVLSALRKMVKVDSVVGTNLARIEVITPDRELSKKIADCLVDSFISSNLQAGIANTNQVSDWLSSQVRSLQEQDQNVDSARELYNAIAHKLREAGIEETIKSAQIRVIEPAAVSYEPVYPDKIRMFTFGFLVALFLSCVSAYVSSFLSRR